MDIKQIFPIIGLSSIISSAISVLVQYIFNKRNDLNKLSNEQKMKWYITIASHMEVVLYPGKINNTAPSINSHLLEIINEKDQEKIREYFLDEVRADYRHSILYASQDVIESISDFIDTPSSQHFFKVIVCMREDFSGQKIKLNFSQFNTTMGWDI